MGFFLQIFGYFPHSRWKETLDEIADEGKKLKKKQRVKKMFKKRMELFTRFMNDAGVDPDVGLDALVCLFLLK